MYDFEKLGAFYLGRKVDPGTHRSTEELVLYDSKDLTTHAAIIGMTGSGKTGLGIGLIEEAALDHVPVIAIDPKGDLGNLLLTFPALEAADFRPWINTRQAEERGVSADEYAAEQATLWQNGLADWGQDGARIARLRDSVDMAIYTPGSNAGRPLSLLQSFAAPAAAQRRDADLYRERVQATATGILSLVGVDADPVSSREHILVSQVLDHTWRDGRDLDLPGLIGALQHPPMTTVGVMSVDSFFPANERFKLAMRLNNLLAAPGFEAWMRGEALSAARLLHTPGGKPRVSVLSIAHLGERERMFFVTMLLNEIIAWMRAQQGTPSLRAILYMDELAGYMPPVANPPSKSLFLTLLKQARAYGLGLVLATQNPVDLDYKGLSNTGTWFIGRLQTERDKMRVMEGLEGARHGGRFDRRAVEQTIAGLGKRQFLLHNVHEDEAVVFNTRWVMSYLAGPLTRDQIRTLTEAEAAASPAESAPASGGARGAGSSSDAAPAGDPTPGPAVSVAAPQAAAGSPLLPPGVRQFHLPSAGDGIVCYPRVVAEAEMHFADARYAVDERRRLLVAADVGDNGRAPDWNEAEALPLAADALEQGPAPARCATLPPAAARPESYAAWEKQFRRWVRQNEAVRLLKSARLRMISQPGESEGDFRVRLQQAASEARDTAIEKIRKRYAGKLATLESRLLRAEQAIARASEQASGRALDTAVSFGTAILGAVLGRKRLSATTASRLGTAIRTAGRQRKQSADVGRAEETAAKVRADIEALNAQLQQEIDGLETAYDAQAEELGEVLVRARVADVHVPLFGLLWMPYRDSGNGRLERVSHG